MQVKVNDGDMDCWADNEEMYKQEEKEKEEEDKTKTKLKSEMNKCARYKQLNQCLRYDRFS